MRTTQSILSGTFAVLTPLLMALPSAPALAQTVDVRAAVSGTSGTALTADGGASMRASLSGETDGSVSSNGDGEQADATASSDTSVSSSVITRADVEAAKTILTDIALVTTDADFSAYVKGQMRKNANITRVTTSSDAVVLESKRKARVFGVIPITITTTTTISADGIVTVRYPWYSFLLSTDEATVKAALKSRINAVSAEDLSVSSKARLLAQVTDTLSSTTNISVSESIVTRSQN